MVLTGQYSIWVKWAPPLERSQLTTIAGSGNWYLNLILCALSKSTQQWTTKRIKTLFSSYPVFIILALKN